MLSNLKRALFWRQLLASLVISLMIGVCCGVASAIFLHVLDFITVTRDTHRWLFYFLPFAGALIAWIYLRAGHSVERGNDLVIEEFHRPSKTVPLRLAPVVLIGTWLTHLVGGSAGREGTAVQMGASIADQFAKLRLRWVDGDRRALLMAGMSGGFGSVFGVPVAGMIFGLEVLTVGELHLWALFDCAISSFAANLTAELLNVHHAVYSRAVWFGFTWKIAAWLLIAGLCFGLSARLFTWLIHFISSNSKKWIQDNRWRAFCGGLLLSMIFVYVPTAQRYAGLGVPILQQSLEVPIFAWDWISKTVMTTLTLGFGFKGGEVTPLLFIGSTLGNALSAIIALPLPMLAMTGFVSVFAGASRTPFACAIMAVELFGGEVGLYALITCLISAALSGAHGIYKSQKARSAYLPKFHFNRIYLETLASKGDNVRPN